MALFLARRGVGLASQCNEVVRVVTTPSATTKISCKSGRPMALTGGSKSDNAKPTHPMTQAGSKRIRTTDSVEKTGQSKSNTRNAQFSEPCKASSEKSRILEKHRFLVKGTVFPLAEPTSDNPVASLIKPYITNCTPFVFLGAASSRNAFLETIYKIIVASNPGNEFVGVNSAGERTVLNKLAFSEFMAAGHLFNGKMYGSLNEQPCIIYINTLEKETPAESEDKAVWTAYAFLEYSSLADLLPGCTLYDQQDKQWHIKALEAAVQHIDIVSDATAPAEGLTSTAECPVKLSSLNGGSSVMSPAPTTTRICQLPLRQTVEFIFTTTEQLKVLSFKQFVVRTAQARKLATRQDSSKHTPVNEDSTTERSEIKNNAGEEADTNETAIKEDNSAAFPTALIYANTTTITLPDGFQRIITLKDLISTDNLILLDMPKNENSNATEPHTWNYIFDRVAKITVFYSDRDFSSMACLCKTMEARSLPIPAEYQWLLKYNHQ